MKKAEIKYLLGVDGGGTKTEFLLTDINRIKISSLILGASNPVNVVIETAKSVLSHGITEVCRGICFEEISAFVGLAGGGSDNVKTEIADFLNRFNFGKVSNGSDIDSVLEVALKGAHGSAVILGTGIVAFSQKDGVRQRSGGWGFMVDKGGSGFCYGADALNEAFKFIDGRNGSELIFNLVEEKLGKSPEKAVSDIYGGGPSFVASFAPIVFEAYKMKDAAAKKIIEGNARETAEIISASRHHLDETDKTVICGGLCKQKDILNQYIREYLTEEIPLVFSDEPIVNGALFLAKSNI